LFCFLFVCSSLPTDFFFCCFFVSFIIVGFLFLLLLLLSFFSFSLSILSSLPSSSSHPYSHPLHSPSFSCAKTHCSLLPQHILSPLTLSLSPAHTFPSHSPPTCHQDYCFLLYTHHSLNDLLYQLYTTPNSCNP
jgi:hypothetical protein